MPVVTVPTEKFLSCRMLTRSHLINRNFILLQGVCVLYGGVYSSYTRLKDKTIPDAVGGQKSIYKII